MPKTPSKKTAKRTIGAKEPARKAADEMVVVASKIKKAIHDRGCNTAGDALAGLNGYVHWLVQQATQRAKANGRKTVRSHDFVVP